MVEEKVAVEEKVEVKVAAVVVVKVAVKVAVEEEMDEAAVDGDPVSTSMTKMLFLRCRRSG